MALSFQEGVGSTPYNGLYGESLLGKGTFVRLQVYERVGIHKLRYIKGREISQLGI